MHRDKDSNNHTNYTIDNVRTNNYTKHKHKRNNYTMRNNYTTRIINEVKITILRRRRLPGRAAGVRRPKHIYIYIYREREIYIQI